MTRSAYGLDSDPDTQLWRTKARCTPDTAELFWPIKSTGWQGAESTPAAQQAFALCRSCPVIAECEAYEAKHPSPWPHIAAGRMWS